MTTFIFKQLKMIPYINSAPVSTPEYLGWKSKMTQMPPCSVVKKKPVEVDLSPNRCLDS